MQATQGDHGFLLSWTFGVAKAHASCMADKGVQEVQVAPACFGCTLTEVVFFAVAFAKICDVKQPDVSQAVASYVHAESDPCGHINDFSAVALGE